MLRPLTEEELVRSLHTPWPAPSSGGVSWLHLPWSLATGQVLDTFYHLCKSLKILPASESLRSWHWPFNQTGSAPSPRRPRSPGDHAVCSLDHRRPASLHRSKPGQLSAAHVPFVSQGQTKCRISTPPWWHGLSPPGAKATGNHGLDAVGSDSESSSFPDMSFR